MSLGLAVSLVAGSRSRVSVLGAGFRSLGVDFSTFNPKHISSLNLQPPGRRIVLTVRS